MNNISKYVSMQAKLTISTNFHAYFVVFSDPIYLSIFLSICICLSSLSNDLSIYLFVSRFQIQDITVISEEDQETRSAKDALLLWCQVQDIFLFIYLSISVQSICLSIHLSVFLSPSYPDLLLSMYICVYVLTL